MLYPQYFGMSLAEIGLFGSASIELPMRRKNAVFILPLLDLLPFPQCLFGLPLGDGDISNRAKGDPRDTFDVFEPIFS